MAAHNSILQRNMPRTDICRSEKSIARLSNSPNLCYLEYIQDDSAVVAFYSAFYKKGTLFIEQMMIALEARGKEYSLIEGRFILEANELHRFF